MAPLTYAPSICGKWKACIYFLQPISYLDVEAKIHIVELIHVIIINRSLSIELWPVDSCEMENYPIHFDFAVVSLESTPHQNEYTTYFSTSIIALRFILFQDLSCSKPLPSMGELVIKAGAHRPVPE